jgi:hypothetical protein
MRGICGLCKEDADLCNSHFMPSALYKFMKAPELPNPNPILLDGRSAISKSIEVRQHFLCKVCEGRFSANGEAWTVRNCFQPDGSFPLYEKVTAIRRSVVSGHVRLYPTDGVADIAADKLTYFASSIIWRSGATNWRNHNRRTTLGRYEEQLRLYLLGDSDFPVDAALRVTLRSPANAELLMRTPYGDRIAGMRCVSFMIPGILFTLFMAQHIPPVLKLLMLAPSADRVIGVSDAMHHKAMQGVAKVMRAATAKGKLANFLSGPDPRKGTR